MNSYFNPPESLFIAPMRSVFLILFLIFITFGFSQQPSDFRITNRENQALGDSIAIISGMSIELATNFHQIRGETVPFANPVDRTSNNGPFSIGFSFPYYNGSYNSFHIGSNGYITFEDPPYNPATVIPNIPFASTIGNFPKNAIFGCFKRWNPNDNEFVTILRDELNNRLVVTWCQVPAQISTPVTDLPFGTFQIVLYPDGIIDIHLIEIQSSGFAGDRTATGIQSAFSAGTAPAGRNWNDNWPFPVQNESYRYTPNETFTDYTVESFIFEPVNVPRYVTWYKVNETNELTEIGEELTLSVKPDQRTVYRAVLRSCWGEEIASDEIIVNVVGIFPNAFKPQSNFAENREFKMILQEGIPVNNFRLQIYNRWGQLIFETTDPYIGWNGKTYNTGVKCPSGIYNWALMFDDNGSTRITNTGSVMLVR